MIPAALVSFFHFTNTRCGDGLPSRWGLRTTRRQPTAGKDHFRAFGDSTFSVLALMSSGRLVQFRLEFIGHLSMKSWKGARGDAAVNGAPRLVPA